MNTNYYVWRKSLCVQVVTFCCVLSSYSCEYIWRNFFINWTHNIWWPVWRDACLCLCKNLHAFSAKVSQEIRDPTHALKVKAILVSQRHLAFSTSRNIPPFVTALILHSFQRSYPPFIPSHINPVHILICHVFEIHFNIIFQYISFVSPALFHSGFPPKINPYFSWH